ncbi:hypothetical protein C3Y91_21280 [Rhizobium sp. UPM1133]|nr:hypothetical protein [Rhizobium ruizarguesonis]
MHRLLDTAACLALSAGQADDERWSTSNSRRRFEGLDCTFLNSLTSILEGRGGDLACVVLDRADMKGIPEGTGILPIA